MREQPQAKSTTCTRIDARLKWLFSYCLLSTPGKAGAAQRTRSTWGKRGSPGLPVTLTGHTNGGRILVSPVSHSVGGSRRREHLSADVPSRLGTASWKRCWIWRLSLSIAWLGADGRLKLWGFGSLQVRQDPGRSRSADTASGAPCTPLPQPPGSPATTGTKADWFICMNPVLPGLTNSAGKASAGTVLPHFL